MKFAQSEELPPLDILPVSVQMTIFESGSGYTAYIMTDMGANMVMIPLKPADVKNLNQMLHDAIQRVASTFEQSASYNQALDNLARMGNYAFLRIFSDDSTRQMIRQALNRGTIVQIVSKDFFVPWELLYDGPLDQRAGIQYYWGMKQILSRLIPQERREGALASTIISELRPKVGLVPADNLKFVTEQEVPALKRLHQSKLIQLKALPALSKEDRSVGLDEFGQFLSQKVQILHFACHAFEQEPIDQSYLFLSKDFPISMVDFDVGQYMLKHHPFVVLNACLTSVLNPLYTSSWAQKFWAQGARGVLATDFKVPDWFGATFSEALYQKLVAGVPIGEALLTLRRTFWLDKRNPLGLAYALYSSPSIQIKH